MEYDVIVIGGGPAGLSAAIGIVLDVAFTGNLIRHDAYQRHPLVRRGRPPVRHEALVCQYCGGPMQVLYGYCIVHEELSA